MINPGTRVHTTQWGGLDGTVTSVHEDGDTIYVKWDGVSFTEDEVLLAEVEVIDGTGDPAVPYATFEATHERPRITLGGVVIDNDAPLLLGGTGHGKTLPAPRITIVDKDEWSNLTQPGDRPDGGDDR